MHDSALGASSVGVQSISNAHRCLSRSGLLRVGSNIKLQNPHGVSVWHSLLLRAKNICRRGIVCKSDEVHVTTYKTLALCICAGS